MFKRLFFIVIYFSCWVVFFETARVFFLLYEWPLTKSLSFSLIIKALLNGAKMDASMAAYFSIIPSCFVIVSLYFNSLRKRFLYITYTATLLFFELFIIIGDAEMYKVWGSKIDATSLKYLSSPAELWASISYLPLFWIGFIFVICYFLLLKITIKVFSNFNYLLHSNEKKVLQLFLVLLISISLIIPIRGGVQLAPINQSSVYFCNNNYANNVAINASWNFMYSVMRMNRLSQNFYQYMKEDEANKYVNDLFNNENKVEQIIEVKDGTKPNLLFIVWESFTEKVVNKMVQGKFIVPNFQNLIKEGIYFENCYASGDRTDKGISAVLSGYPAMPKTSIVNHPEKTTHLPGLGKTLFENGFSTNFYYGGEAEFANIKSYLFAQKFEKLITKNDFLSSQMISKWGVHDDVIAKKLVDDIPKMKQPFFTTWLTLSSHEPFEIPTNPVFKGNDDSIQFFNSLFYTDSCVGAFIAELKKMELWKNTVVVIVADHGHYLPISENKADAFRIPLLLLGGALNNQNKLIKKTVSQLDVANTMVQQLGFNTQQFSFSKNLFDASSKSWSAFTFNEGIGFVTDSSRIVFDHISNKNILEEGKTNKSQTEIAKAILQSYYSDFLKR